MLDITLISPYPDITVFGLRTMSAWLKAHGHRTRMIFLPDPYADAPLSNRQRRGGKIYSQQALNQLIALCSDSDLIGITLMTNYFYHAVELTTAIRKSLHTPIIWGGVHPTIRPEECLKHADIVCVGEGEDALLELANKMASNTDYLTTPNLWIKTPEDAEGADGSKGIVKNHLRALTRNLDIYPLPDYSFNDHYVLQEGRIIPLDYEATRAFLMLGTVSVYLNRVGYQTMTGRGCPHSCTYCINDTLRTLYSGKGTYMRWRSVASVIEELSWVKANMPFVGYIWISDDAFFARGTKAIAEFCQGYKREIALPFSALASPLTVTEEKMALLVDAGLCYLQMGIESASDKTQRLFNRQNMSNDVIMKAIRIINKYKDRMYPPSYDFILDVPYETDEDRRQTLRFISEIPRPYQLQPFSLVLYPQTRLYQMARADGLIADEHRDIYDKSYTTREPSYLNLLMTLCRRGRFPAALLRLLIAPPVVRLFSGPLKRPFREVYKGLHRLYRLVMRRG
ncbi:MAG: B12-binding domain-containing radical SAM protein [Nitrospirae bacterium]|nr:B12-binding domain-containing radical SAM protein [Nitrospirota bacterium]